MALDPDGVTFWTIYPYYDYVNGLGYYNLYRTKIQTGKLITNLPSGKGAPYGRYYSGSIGVYGDGMNSTASWTAALKFGRQLEGTASPSKTVTIKNAGSVEMVVSNVEISGDFVISNNRCSGIRPGTHCNIYVQFQPTQLGVRDGALTVFDNATKNPQTTNLSGSGDTTSATVLTSSPNPSNFGQTVTFTANVTSNAPSTPTGTVTFMSGSQKIGKAALNAGRAILQTSKLPVGTLSITAAYSGDAENLKSTSPVLAQVVNNPD